MDDKCIIHFDNDVCHYAKQNRLMEVRCGTAKSLKGIQGNPECQPTGNGTLMRRITADDQPDRTG